MNHSFGIGSRRHWLQTASAGFGYLAFAGISGRNAATASPTDDATTDQSSPNPLAAKSPHFPATAKRVIFLCMQGGPSHVDTFDYKPELQDNAGRPGVYGGRLLASQWKFRQRGESGLWISDLFPNVAKHADDLALIRSMHCDQPVHPRALTQMHTGNAQFVRPSLGAWTLYGLGTENESLPGFISLNPPRGASQNMGSAFLPAVYQGTGIGRTSRRVATNRRQGSSNPADQVPDIKNARLGESAQRRQLAYIQSLNRRKLSGDSRDAAIEGAIESLELAFRMQDAVPELMDIGNESDATRRLYGLDNPTTSSFGMQCLMARKFAEAGVRFVEVTHGNWDHHFRLSTSLPQRCGEVDLPIAGLLADLKQRDLLKDTLVIWGGEFGRTPDAPGGDGRDHNNNGYTLWMAGGGVQGGISCGATDEFGFKAVENPCHIHDWHATILHLMGLDHKRLTYRYAGRDFRLTDVAGNVVTDILRNPA
ncbi:DUF1501 domain-containing protein [Crateriforma conspicua]|uniref:Sulfatase n=1 Tax=Crateriforma conspicua TaxID=2527996 RepID=A0A5C5XXD7_9PLAN|nr:DUF1501 domain-containing protein [Crateriforma conspicua]TWT68007.1 hypothetical protein Pan14r_02450 [Crateriforma conspicua]